MRAPSTRLVTILPRSAVPSTLIRESLPSTPVPKAPTLMQHLAARKLAADKAAARRVPKPKFNLVVDQAKGASAATEGIVATDSATSSSPKKVSTKAALVKTSAGSSQF